MTIKKLFSEVILEDSRNEKTKKRNEKQIKNRKPLFSVGDKVVITDHSGNKRKTIVLDILPIKVGSEVLYFYIIDCDDQPFVSEYSVEKAS